MDSNSISNFISYNAYYGLFLTYVFPIFLLILICLVIGYLASINRKLNELLIKDYDKDKLDSKNTDIAIIVVTYIIIVLINSLQ